MYIILYCVYCFFYKELQKNFDFLFPPPPPPKQIQTSPVYEDYLDMQLILWHLYIFF